MTTAFGFRLPGIRHWMVSLWHGACTHPFVLVPYKARKELNLADVEPEEDPQAKDWNPIGGWMFGLSFCGSTWWRQRWVSHWPGTSLHFARILLLSARASSERRVRTGQVCCFQSSIVACLRDLKSSTSMGFKNISLSFSLEFRSWCKSPLALPRALRKP